MLDVFGSAATGRTSTQATAHQTAFFVNPAHRIEGEGIGTGLEVVSFGYLNEGEEQKRKESNRVVRSISKHVHESVGKKNSHLLKK